MLIGLCGAAGSGKNTVAEFLTEFAQIAFADPLYECVSTIDIPETLFHVTRIQHRLNIFLDRDCK